MKYYNKNTNTILSEQEYLELIEKEAKELYPDYLENTPEDEDPMDFDTYKMKLIEMESDFEVIEE